MENFRILTDEQYDETLSVIYDLMNKGEDRLSQAETEQLKLMAIAAEKYEDVHLELKPKQKATCKTSGFSIKI